MNKNAKKINKKDSIIESTSIKIEAINDIESNTAKSSTNNTESNSKQRDSTDSAKSHENTDSSLESSTADSKKLDSNADEIIWELRQIKNPLLSPWFLWTFIGRVGSIIALAYIIYLLSNYIMLVLILSLIIFYYAILLILTFNVRTLFITNQHLILQKYIGKDLVLKLGEFYCNAEGEPNGLFIANTIVLRPIFENRILPYYYIMDLYYTNIVDIRDVVKSYVKSTLLKLDDKEYNKFANLNRHLTSSMFIDFDEIDKLREEHNNGE